MPGQFETIDLGAVNSDLRIEIDAGAGCMGNDMQPDTDFYIKPPLTEDEHGALVKHLSPESEVGKLLVAGVEKGAAWLKVTADGEPSQEHVDLGIELAEEIIMLKGLRAGKVVAAFQTHLVRRKSEAEQAGEDITVIDADEFEEAVRNPDPNWLEMLTRAKEGIEKEKDTDARARVKRLDEAEGNVRIIENGEHHVVLRSPATGNLYGIALNQSPDGEVPEITELEELEG